MIKSQRQFMYGSNFYGSDVNMYYLQFILHLCIMTVLNVSVEKHEALKE